MICKNDYTMKIIKEMTNHFVTYSNNTVTVKNLESIKKLESRVHEKRRCYG